MKTALVLSLLLAGRACLAQFATTPPTPEWIESSQGHTNEATVFTKGFEIQYPLLKGILLGACEGEMSVEINGVSVGRIVGRERASGLDLTTHLQRGTNSLSIVAMNSAGRAKISALLELNADLARTAWVMSDSTWRTSAGAVDKPVRSLGRVDLDPATNPFDPKKAFDAYNSWKLALGTNTATDPGTFTLLPGFKAELLRSAQPGEGSWISLAFDPEGRLTVARESRGLLRMTLASGGVERAEVIDDTLLECRGLLYAYNALYVNANNSKGFFRLRDTDGDDRFDEVKCLLRTKGGVGHGRNHVVLGPDRAIYLVHGNNVTLTENVSSNAPLRNYKNDSLIPCPFDDAMFDGDVLLPAGHILRTDADGTKFELFAGGFRNPLDIAFNRDGEMFTFDADMEWDVGSPWYRPNRVNHVVSGADFGWRRGTAKWPDYFPETLPATLNIGLASPTAIEFGTASAFPPLYKEALFIADWAYGRVIAVHLTAKGASYSATSELFMSGRPLNVTDFAFGPDGAMYLITGGRTTQSGLYRISYVGPKVVPKTPTADDLARESELASVRTTRKNLETLRAAASYLPPKSRRDIAWGYLGDRDSWIRHAARVALENIDVSLWQSRALSETNIDTALTAWLALARFGGPEVRRPLLERVKELPFADLTEAQQLQAIRVCELAFARMGPAADFAAAMREKFEPLYPAGDWRLNHQLCVLLVYLDSPRVIEKTLKLAEAAQTPEDLMQYLFYLRYVRNGWTPGQCAAYFRALDRAEQKQGARDYYSVLKRVRDDVISTLGTNELQFLVERGFVSARNRAATLPNVKNTADLKFVQEWQMSDFDLAQPLRGRSIEKGKAAFESAQCVLCHRFGSAGGLVGPDLTSVASRFDRRTLLESTIEPSKVIDEKFRNTTFVLKDGSTVIGTIDREGEQKVLVRESPFSENASEVSRKNIERREPSPISPMPAGLINVLQREQILDLLAFLESGATNGVASTRR